MILKKIKIFIKELGFKEIISCNYNNYIDYIYDFDIIRITYYKNEKYLQIIFFIKGVCQDVINIYRNSINLSEFYFSIDLYHKEKFRKYKINKLLLNDK